MEERAAVCALDGLMEKNCSLIQEIEQDLARLSVAQEQVDTEPDTMSFFSFPEQQEVETVDRVVDLLNRTDPVSVRLDEVKADQILNLINNMLLFICSQTPIVKTLIRSYSSEASLDPQTAHPKLIISPKGDSATYTDTWQQLPDLPGRFDTTLNVISLQSYNFGRHYWEVDVTGKTYWELGVTYPTISRKGTTEECWLGRGDGSWCVEFFDGEYTAWHGGVPHQLPFTKHFCRIGAFSDCLHLALCPGHDHSGTNSKPIAILNAQSPPTVPSPLPQTPEQ
ncbi:uncharacterized protein V6R79_005046 [Siganus canaliculatus]